MRSNRFLAVTAVLALAAMLSGGRAAAAPVAVVAQQTPALPSSFSLDFGFFGGVSSAQISQTDFELEIDADLGTAEFRQYDQFVAPLTLPGGISTGNLRVEVVAGSSSGEFDSLTGEFTTEELYAIHFDGDLSAYGLTSPVFLPGESSGVVSLSALAGGDIVMAWDGTSQLPNPFDPLSTIPFSYTCHVRAAFAPEPVALVQLAMLPNVLNLNLPEGLEAMLLSTLDKALSSMVDGQNTKAASTLTRFIQRIQNQGNGIIPAADADSLISDAEGAIDLLGSQDTKNPRGLMADVPKSRGDSR